MQVELKVNGKTVHAEISEEQAKILGLVEDTPKTGYERGKNGKLYYCVDEDGMKMIIYKMQTILPVALYPLYMQFGWRKKRMADIGQTAKFVLMDMMNGRIKKIKDTIRNECKMVFHSDGRIEYLDRRN